MRHTVFSCRLNTSTCMYSTVDCTVEPRAYFGVKKRPLPLLPTHTAYTFYLLGTSLTDWQIS